MKKFLPYILILTVIVQIFAPFTVGINRKNNIEIQTIQAEAVYTEWDGSEEAYKGAFPNSNLSVNTSYVEALGDEEPTITGSIDVSIDTGGVEGTDTHFHWLHTEAQGATYIWGLFDTGASVFHPDDFVLVVKETSSNTSGLMNITYDMLHGIDTNGNNYDLTEKRMLASMSPSIKSNILITTTSLKSINGLNKLKPGEKYTASLYYRVWSGADSGVGYGENIPTISGALGAKDYIKIATVDFTAATKENPIIEGDTSLQDSGQTQVKDGGIDLPACTLFPARVGGCLAQGIYYLFFKTTSFVFGLAGKILDFTIMYSIDDTSYRSSFVVEGWGLIRDFCNIFFIFILLYIAIGTILNLHGVKPKEMIINVVIIGLLINFSLFATQVIIDASNILTRVFYNQKTIITGTQKDAAGNPVSELGDFGEIQLSEAIVSKVNPQKLIMEASRVDSIPVRGSSTNEDREKTSNITPSTFILVTLLATAVNLVGIMAFFSSALIFIGRVVMLWLSMIFAPLAFFSYIVPKLKGVKMVGWEHWWPDTLSMAFVAPVFVFFMYLIVGFMSTGLDIVNSSMKDASTISGSLNFVIAIVVPFIFIMILLMKAKSIAVNMSGEMGAAMAKAGSVVGGAVVGAGLMAATGGAAMAMRGTLGALGSKIGESEWAKKNGRIGRMVGDAGKWTAGKTFDARNTQLGAAAAGGLGVGSSIGKAKEGGYTKYKAEAQEKAEKRAKSLELGHDTHEVHDLHTKQEILKKLQNSKEEDLAAIEGKLTAWGKDAHEKSIRASSFAANDTSIEAVRAREASKTANDLLQGEKDKKRAIRMGTATDANGNYNTSNGNISQTGLDEVLKDETNAIDDLTSTNNTLVNSNNEVLRTQQALAIARSNQANTANKTIAEMATDREAVRKADAEHLVSLNEQAKATRAVQTAQNKVTLASNSANTARASAARATAPGGGGLGRSMDDLEFTDIRDARLKVSTINNTRKTAYADEIQSRWFNKKINKHAAHNIRMNSEIKASGGH